MPRWIHSRAEHLLAKNPDMSKSQAFAIATQQSHAAGKTPKGYGTAEGKSVAKEKFDKPKKEYEKTPNPGSLDSPKLKSAGVGSAVGSVLKQVPGLKGGTLPFLSRMRDLTKNVSTYTGFATKTGAAQDDSSGIGIGGALGLGSGAYTGGQLLTAVAGEGALSALEQERRLKGNSKTFQELQRVSPVPVVQQHGEPEHYAGRAATWVKDKGGIKAPKVPHIVMPTGAPSAGLLAHEVGHAKIDQHLLGRVLQSPLTGVLGKSALPGFLAGGLAGRYSDDSNKGALLSAGIPAAATIPMLAAEGGASISGIRDMKRIGASPEQLATAKKLLSRAFLTYAGVPLTAAGVGLGTYGVSRYLSRNKRKAQQVKTSSAYRAFFDELCKQAGYLHDKVGDPKKRVLSSSPPNAEFQVKQAFTESQYGPGTTGSRPDPEYVSGMPPFRVPSLKTAGPSSEKKKQAAVVSPLSQLRKAQRVGASKLMDKGPSIAQQAKPIGFGTPSPSAIKQ